MITFQMLHYHLQVLYLFCDVIYIYISCVGTSVKIIIFSSRINEVSFTDKVILNLLSGDRMISSNAMMRCGNLLAGMIVIPNVPFRYQLTGYDTKGNYFSKTKDAELNSPMKVTTCDLPIPFPTSSIMSIPAVSTNSGSGLVPSSEIAAPVAPTATPTTTATATTPEASFHCPCHNGGSCVTIVRFGRLRVLCSCPKGYTGSLCQSSELMK